MGWALHWGCAVEVPFYEFRLEAMTAWQRERPFTRVGVLTLTDCKPSFAYRISKKVGQIFPPTPLNFSTKAAIFWKTVCFLVRNCGFNGLILGRTALSSVPFSVANSRFSELVI